MVFVVVVVVVVVTLNEEVNRVLLLHTNYGILVSGVYICSKQGGLSHKSVAACGSEF